MCWDLGGGLTHIGLLVEARSDDGSRPLVVHNIGNGQELCLGLVVTRMLDDVHEISQGFIRITLFELHHD